MSIILNDSPFLLNKKKDLFKNVNLDALEPGWYLDAHTIRTFEIKLPLDIWISMKSLG